MSSIKGEHEDIVFVLNRFGAIRGVPMGRVGGANLGFFFGTLFGASAGSWKCLDVFNKKGT